MPPPSQHTLRQAAWQVIARARDLCDKGTMANGLEVEEGDAVSSGNITHTLTAARITYPPQTFPCPPAHAHARCTQRAPTCANVRTRIIRAHARVYIYHFRRSSSNHCMLMDRSIRGPSTRAAPTRATSEWSPTLITPCLAPIYPHFPHLKSHSHPDFRPGPWPRPRLRWVLSKFFRTAPIPDQVRSRG